MWRTPSGERTLRGAEWELFREGLADLWDFAEQTSDDPEPYETGVQVFDQLQANQKLALLALAGRSLADSATPPPRLTAHLEGTIAAVFAQIRNGLIEEVDLQLDQPAGEISRSSRERVLAAASECEIDWDEPLPDSGCTESEEWDCLLECLEGGILWDGDYATADAFLDRDPKRHAT